MTDDEIGISVRGATVSLTLGRVRTEMSADAARAVATLLLTGADLAEARHPDDDESEPTTHDRGEA